MRLDQARASTSGASELIDATTVELLAAIREVRDLARGVHPPILTDAGLAAAIEALASGRRSPSRSRRRSSATRRRSRPRPTFVVAEGLTNIARYADASAARVVVRNEGERLVVRVTTTAGEGRTRAPERASAGWPIGSRRSAASSR
jgi:signal transduction histidine kinase